MYRQYDFLASSPTGNPEYGKMSLLSGVRKSHSVEVDNDHSSQLDSVPRTYLLRFFYRSRNYVAYPLWCRMRNILPSFFSILGSSVELAIRFWKRIIHCTTQRNRKIRDGHTCHPMWNHLDDILLIWHWVYWIEWLVVKYLIRVLCIKRSTQSHVLVIRPLHLSKKKFKSVQKRNLNQNEYCWTLI